jgi:hypothetical protein
MSHTPGPWTWRVGAPGQDCGAPVGTIVGRDDALVCDFGDATQFYPDEGMPPNDADRALIVAAPDLLAALKGMLDQPETPESYDAMMERANAAIAKAEGR